MQRGGESAPSTPVGPLPHHISVLGVTGLTAYFGLLDVGRPAPGETVVVSAAAGAIGNIVGADREAEGLPGGGGGRPGEKNRWLVDALGLDAAVDYRPTASVRS